MERKVLCLAPVRTVVLILFCFSLAESGDVDATPFLGTWNGQQAARYPTRGSSVAEYIFRLDNGVIVGKAHYGYDALFGKRETTGVIPKVVFGNDNTMVFKVFLSDGRTAAYRLKLDGDGKLRGVGEGKHPTEDRNLTVDVVLTKVEGTSSKKN